MSNTQNQKQFIRGQQLGIRPTGSWGQSHVITPLNPNNSISGSIHGLGVGSSISFENHVDDNQYVKTYQVIDSTEDLLALSVTWFRLRNTGASLPVHTLTSEVLYKELTQQDRDVADSIRKYYSQKLMVLKLKNNNLSKYRQDLNSFIHGSTHIFKKDILPLVYRLPEFYLYDIDFDQLKSEHNVVIKNFIKPVRSKHKLTFAKSFVVGKSVNKRKEFWFSDEDKNLVNLTVLNNNPLISLLENQFTSPIELTGIYSKRTRDDYEYFIVDKYSF